MRPRTKHINVKYHHFRSYVANKQIEIHSVKTDEQLADLWTKPLGEELFRKFTDLSMGTEEQSHNTLSEMRECDKVTEEVST